MWSEQMTDKVTHPAPPPASRGEEWKYAEKAMTWYGWGSPVGAGIFFVGLGVFILLLRFAVAGL
jgi:hypothetical protein